MSEVNETLLSIFHKHIEDELNKDSSLKWFNLNIREHRSENQFIAEFKKKEFEQTADINQLKSVVNKAIKNVKICKIFSMINDGTLEIDIYFKITKGNAEKLLQQTIPQIDGKPILFFCKVEVVELWQEFHWDSEKRCYRLYAVRTYKPDEKSPPKKVITRNRICSSGHSYLNTFYVPDRRYINVTEKADLQKKPVWKKIEAVWGEYELVNKTFCEQIER